MIGIIVYIGACVAFAIAATTLYVMTRPIQSRDELRSWRVLLFMFVLAIGAPYGYAEILTKSVGQTMQGAVSQTLDEAGVGGTINYYKVVWYSGQSARVVATATEKATWGEMTDRAVLAMTLRRSGDSWKPDTYRIVCSENKNADGFTFPPYF